MIKKDKKTAYQHAKERDTRTKFGLFDDRDTPIEFPDYFPWEDAAHYDGWRDFNGEMQKTNGCQPNA